MPNRYPFRDNPIRDSFSSSSPPQRFIDNPIRSDAVRRNPTGYNIISNPVISETPKRNHMRALPLRFSSAYIRTGILIRYPSNKSPLRFLTRHIDGDTALIQSTDMTLERFK